MTFKLLPFACLMAIIGQADILDLSSGPSGASGTRNGATFTVNDFRSSGTGVLDPFLRINNDRNVATCGESNRTRECGYNTAGTVDPKTDTKTDPHTHALLMSSYIGTFLLDINEPGANGKYISIDQLQIYGANAADVNTASTTFSTTPVFPNGTLTNPNLTLLWSLDGPTNNTDYTIFVADLFSGSGATDLKIEIPKSLFYQPATNYSHLVLFAHLGNVDSGSLSGDAESGFEEFANVQAASVPDGGVSLMLLGGALVGLETLRRKFRV